MVWVKVHDLKKLHAIWNAFASGLWLVAVFIMGIFGLMMSGHRRS
jgi:hypothetical protein